MGLTTKLFLILLLTGALASEKTDDSKPGVSKTDVNDKQEETLNKAKTTAAGSPKSDCVEKLEEGEKYYIKLEEDDKTYSYVFGTRTDADAFGYAQLEAIKGAKAIYA